MHTKDFSSDTSDQQQDSVEYRSVVGAPRYRVGSDGTVWSSHRANSKSPVAWWKMKLLPRKRGYLMVYFRVNGVVLTRLVHHVVLESFVGPRPPDMVGCHNNDIAWDNRVVNLRWDTTESNFRDRDRNGRTAKGERIGISKLTAEQVLRIRDMAAAGAYFSDLSKMFGCGENSIANIVRGRTWKHIGGPRLPNMYGRKRRHKEVCQK